MARSCCAGVNNDKELSRPAGNTTGGFLAEKGEGTDGMMELMELNTLEMRPPSVLGGDAVPLVLGASSSSATTAVGFSSASSSLFNVTSTSSSVAAGATSAEGGVSSTTAAGAGVSVAAAGGAGAGGSIPS